MKHGWDHVSRMQQDLAGMYLRRCRHCGAEQELQRDYAWGRQVSRTWRPLVGRCKP